MYDNTINMEIIGCNHRVIFFTGLPPDVMHDILEGNVKLELKCLLYTYIKEKRLFTLSLLNERIRNLNYGPDCSDHPPSDLSDFFLTLSSSGNLKLTGTCCQFNFA